MYYQLILILMLQQQKKRNYSLMLIFFRVDNAFLVSLVGLRPEKYFWLGLSNQKNIDNFVWTNGQFAKFSHWNTGMPGMKGDAMPFFFFFKLGVFTATPQVIPNFLFQQHQVTNKAVWR